MALTIEQIGHITGGTWLLLQVPTQVPVYLLTDSRKATYPELSLFFAIDGATHNGHHFITELYQKGVRNFVVNRCPCPLSDVPEANILLVANVVAALQAIVVWHRRQFELLSVGITGSNGKTIVKEWLHQVVCEQYKTVRSPKSYNSQIGVPLSVWQMSDLHELGIFEAGISEANEMHKLEPIIAPQIGILTNILSAHDKGFANKLEKVGEKLRLFRHSRQLIYSADYAIIQQGIAQNRQLYPNEYQFEDIAWSKQTPDKKKAAVYVRVEKEKQHTLLFFEWKARQLHSTVIIPYSDDAYIENAIHVWVAAICLNIDSEALAQKMARLHPIEMRLEMKAGINNCILINDAYSADLSSLAIALDFMAQQDTDRKRTLILSDIRQSGQPKEQLYEQIAQLIRQKKISRLIGIGSHIMQYNALFWGINTLFFTNTELFLKENVTFANENVLIKGAREFAFEKITAYFEQKSHSTVLEVDLDAIAHNFKTYKQTLRPDTKIMAMVKALSYGSGTFEVANALQFHKADYLAVAYTDEGIALRQNGVSLPILVLNPLPETFNALITYHLEPEVYSLQHLELLLSFLHNTERKKEIHLPIHLKFDTGMRRLGFEEKDLTKLLQIIGNQYVIRIASVFTHLAASENSEHDSFSQQQYECFERMYERLQAVLPYKVMRHLLNSAGIVRHPNMQADMVRLGVGLYGIDSTQTIQKQLANVGTLKTYISQIKEIDAEVTVGYGRAGKTTQNTRIATVGIGYADGLNRKLGNGHGKMYLHGQFAPIIGNICMDMTMLNIGHIPQAKEGDEVIVFGEALPVQTIADSLDTIPYEVLTGISGRVKRVYLSSES